MPAQKPRAAFEPIPPDFDVKDLVETSDNFQYVDRIAYETIADQGIEMFEKLVLLHVIVGGRPLVIDGFENVLDPWTFTPGWLSANEGGKVENARNLSRKENLPLSIGHYLKNMGLLTNQYFDKPDNYRDKQRQRIYLKDIDCPPVWQDKLKEHIPQCLFYYNESTGEVDGPGAVDETGRRKGKGIARAGDLMSSLPQEMRAENLMCYIGHEGTYTPSHREMCATLGQNIMVNASGTIGENGKPEKPGSSIWFMTESSDRKVVSEYWLSVLGHDIEVENHFAQIAAWRKAPFKTYVVEQKPGDFILVPPLAPHQVWNRGTRTMKVAWNRTTVETLRMAIDEALPNARMVCRDEQYKCKAIIYYTLQKYSALLQTAKVQSEASGEAAEALRRSKKLRAVKKDFKSLVDLYKTIMLSEMFAPEAPKEHPEFIPFDSCVTCAYCRCNIFNRFLTCKSCVDALGTENEEPYDICMDCYAMGRSCSCISGLTWVEQWRWKELLYKYDEWRRQVIEIDDGRVTEKTPFPLPEERRNLQKKTLAQICQEQLKRRPWVDYKNPKGDENDEQSDEEIVVNDDGTVRKTVKKRSKAWLNNHRTCHVCRLKHQKWKMAGCTTCDLWYCYGSLFRAHDLMPQEIMENPRWQCPHCRKVCSTGACRRDPRQNPYEPTGTLLGHDTKKVADARSVESLVDFSVSNLGWIRDGEVEPSESMRLQRRREEAARARLDDSTRDHNLDDDEIDAPHDMFDHGTTQIQYSPLGDDDESFLDPSLRTNPQDGNGLPPVGALLPGARPSGRESPLFVTDADDDFGAPPHVAPSGVIYRQGEQEDEDEFMYPDLDGQYEDPGPGESSKKRRRGEFDAIKLVHSKRQNTGKDKSKSAQPKNDATKQFLKKKEKQQLDQAKTEGRYIMVLAAMKGRSRMVKLTLPSEVLAAEKARMIEKRRRLAAQKPAVRRTTPGQEQIIIRSDVAREQPGNTTAASAGTAKKLPNQVRVRLEHDEDFSTGGGRRGKRRPRYEEINVGSDEDEDVEMDDEVIEVTSSRRVRKPLDDDEVIELPSNWKDGKVAREKRRSTLGATNGTAQIRPKHSARHSTGQLGKPSSREDDTDDDAVEEIPRPARAPVANMHARPKSPKPASVRSKTSAIDLARAASAALQEEENRKAKLAAANLSDDDDFGSSDDASSPAKAVQPVKAAKAPPKAQMSMSRPGPPGLGGSILSRMANGKKVKIVSAASKRLGSESTAAKTPSVASSSFTAVNGAQKPKRTPAVSSASKASGSANGKEQSIVVSDDEEGQSEEEIPARSSRSKTVVARAGAAVAKRGRGRPRTTM